MPIQNTVAARPDEQLFDLDIEFVPMADSPDAKLLSTPTSDGSACYHTMCCNSHWGC
jgi:hypothetical protein